MNTTKKLTPNTTNTTNKRSNEEMVEPRTLTYRARIFCKEINLSRATREWGKYNIITHNIVFYDIKLNKAERSVKHILKRTRGISNCKKSRLNKRGKIMYLKCRRDPFLFHSFKAVPAILLSRYSHSHTHSRLGCCPIFPFSHAFFYAREGEYNKWIHTLKLVTSKFRSH